MANYTSSHTGIEIDKAVVKALQSEVISIAEKEAWNSKAAGDHNHNSIYAPTSHNHNLSYAPITHSNNSAIHITADERTAWNDKAAGNHNHNGAYAPITHSNNEDIHVTATQKTTWDGKAPTPTVLYNNASGTQSNFTLSQSAANFTHMRIYYFFSDSGKKITNSLDIINPNGAYPSLMTCQCDANNIYLKIAVLYINGTAVSFHTNANTWISNGGGATIQATTKTIRVTRIEAWN